MALSDGVSSSPTALYRAFSPHSKILFLLTTQSSPDDMVIRLYLLLQSTSFQVTLSLYRCSGYLADGISIQPTLTAEFFSDHMGGHLTEELLVSSFFL